MQRLYNLATLKPLVVASSLLKGFCYEMLRSPEASASMQHQSRVPQLTSWLWPALSRACPESQSASLDAGQSLASRTARAPGLVMISDLLLPQGLKMARCLHPPPESHHGVCHIVLQLGCLVYSCASCLQTHLQSRISIVA